jgi:hypothetical protein
VVLTQIKEFAERPVKSDGDGKGSRAMKAADVMVTNVITVGPEACVQDVAQRN